MRGFGVFLRSMFGPDRGAAQQHFADFIADGASADQIEFISMLIEHLTKNGIVDPGLLYDSPFTDLTPEGPDILIEQPKVEQIFASVRAINRSATADPASEAI